MEKHGLATAKGVRSVLSGMVGMAMRHGAMTTNPTRDVAPISVPKKIVRALTVEETELLVKKLCADKDATRLDLIDLVEFIWICQACGADVEVEVAKLTRVLIGHVPRRRGTR